MPSDRALTSTNAVDRTIMTIPLVLLEPVT